MGQKVVGWAFVVAEGPRGLSAVGEQDAGASGDQAYERRRDDDRAAGAGVWE